MDEAAKSLAQGLSDGCCPQCGNFYGGIIFVDATVDLLTPSDTEMCEMCWELRAVRPEEERPPIEVIEFRDNTRRTDSERREHFFYGRARDLEDEERGRP